MLREEGLNVRDVFIEDEKYYLVGNRLYPEGGGLTLGLVKKLTYTPNGLVANSEDVEWERPEGYSAT